MQTTISRGVFNMIKILNIEENGIHFLCKAKDLEDGSILIEIYGAMNDELYAREVFNEGDPEELIKELISDISINL